MANPGTPLIAVLLDRSGSMATIKKDMEAGFAALIAKQAELPGTALVTLSQFDTHYEDVFPPIPASEVTGLNLQPRGLTALLDALGRFVTEIRDELHRAETMHADTGPDKVIVVVITDGHENASNTWTVEGVRDLVSGQQDNHGWEFVFLGANLDAVEVGRDLGFHADRSLTYSADPDGVEDAMELLSDYVERSRSTPGSPTGFSADDRRRAIGEQD
ncbi:VWA domain-containing protein [Hoyosella sp. G463]|uniref:VWA domain-containing protein n=1 Tax=Lolliginicoccus lacisalsi TaxID=2742202 RepID=A0A927JAX7_9ACTN|nr:vWA domain-containing protein [Lolliginicoccus lacisalsi]MBD8505795.1 VWA domain-containing protein [Lolliginicoccus lacisalsi]